MPRQSGWGATSSRLPFLIVAVVALLLVVFLVFKGCSSCASDTPAGDTPASDNGEIIYTGTPLQQAIVSSDVFSIYLAPVDYESLSSLVGESLAMQLSLSALSNVDARWIVSNLDAYAMEGSAIQAKLLKLAANEPEALKFVRELPSRYPAESAESYTADSSAAGADKERPPLLYQWDQRWGYTVYSSTAFALTGCCPTALSMVYQGLTGKTDLSPYDMGVRAKNAGYMTTSSGTDARFLVNEAATLGLRCNEVPSEVDELTSALSNGALIIANMAPGDFTEGGHYIVLAGLDADGNVIVNDSYSSVRSAKTWSPELIADQAISFYVYYAA